jgi:hypothetical protein
MLFREMRILSAMLFVCERHDPAVKTTETKWDSLVNLIGFKNLTIGTSMIELAALASRACCRFAYGEFDNIRRRRLGGVERILRKFNGLTSELRVAFETLGNLLFNFGDAHNVGTLSLGRNNWSSKRLLWLLPGARSPPHL